MRVLTRVAWLGSAMILAGTGGGTAAAAEKAVETLIWTYTDFAELRANAKTWHDVKGIDGFIFCMVNGVGVPRWTTGAEGIEAVYEELPETVETLRQAGITANFVHAGIDDSKWDWFDEAKVSQIVPTFGALAKVAKAAGCRGVAIDTEPYSCHKKLWDPTAYPSERRGELRERVRRVGAEFMKALLAEFPEAEILVLPEGGYIAMQNSPGGYLLYEMWMDFFNGLISLKPPQGVHVMCECAYNWTDSVRIGVLDGATFGYIQARCDDVAYWRNQCTRGYGALLILKAEGQTDRSVPDFARQWETMTRLSGRYRWVFAGESGFCHIPGYDKKPNWATVESFGKPLAANADAYFEVIRNSRVAPDEPAE